jgi:hypothetical protein
MKVAQNNFSFRFVAISTLLLVATTLLLRFWHLGEKYWSDWLVLLPIIQIVVAGFLILRYRSTRSIYIYTLISTVIIFLMAAAIYHRKFDFAIFLFADIVVHFIMPVCWLITIAGCLAIPFFLKRRLYLPLRIWLLITATLLAAEPASRFFESEKNTELNLPDNFMNSPEEEIHIAAIGGSSTLGHPYHPKYGFAKVVRWRIQQLYPNRKIVLHNLAKGGLNLRQAANELNSLTVRPSILLIYTGHNEFYHQLDEFSQNAPPRFTFFDSWMRWSALYRVTDNWISWKRTETEFRSGRRYLVDWPIASSRLHQTRLERFRKQCEQLSQFCQREHITPIWFIPAASESGFDPNRSGYRANTTPLERAELNATFRAANTLNCQSAAEDYRRILSRYPDFAECHYRLAKCFQKMGTLSAAQHHFGEALNHDQYPLRANRSYREIIRQTALASNAPLVETIRFLRPHDKDHILGSALFLDNVHMTLKGYYLTGLAGCDAIIQSQVLTKAFGPVTDAKPLTLADAIKKSGLNREDLIRAYKHTAMGFAEMERWRFDGTFRHQRSLHFQNLVDSLGKKQIDPGQNGTESLKPD